MPAASTYLSSAKHWPHTQRQTTTDAQTRETRLSPPRAFTKPTSTLQLQHFSFITKITTNDANCTPSTNDVLPTVPHFREKHHKIHHHTTPQHCPTYHINKKNINEKQTKKQSTFHPDLQPQPSFSKPHTRNTTYFNYVPPNQKITIKYSTHTTNQRHLIPQHPTRSPIPTSTPIPK